jgi:hypothetical protein
MPYEVYFGETTDGFNFAIAEKGNAYVFNLACQFERTEPVGYLELRGLQPIDALSFLECENAVDVAVIKDGVLTRFDTDKKRTELINGATRVFGVRLTFTRKGISHSRRFSQTIITFPKGVLDIKGVYEIL